MIEAKHELRHNYIELFYLIEEAFSDWLLPNLSWIIPVIVILAFAIPILTVIRRLTKGHVSKNSCIVQTVGFIRSTQQTGLYVNENPQLLFELDALAEDVSDQRAQNHSHDSDSWYGSRQGDPHPL